MLPALLVLRAARRWRAGGAKGAGLVGSELHVLPALHCGAALRGGAGPAAALGVGGGPQRPPLCGRCARQPAPWRLPLRGLRDGAEPVGSAVLFHGQGGGAWLARTAGPTAGSAKQASLLRPIGPIGRQTYQTSQAISDLTAGESECHLSAAAGLHIAGPRLGAAPLAATLPALEAGWATQRGPPALEKRNPRRQ